MKRPCNQLHSFDAIDLSEDEMATYTGGTNSGEGLATIRRLQEEFQAELATTPGKDNTGPGHIPVIFLP